VLAQLWSGRCADVGRVCMTRSLCAMMVPTARAHDSMCVDGVSVNCAEGCYWCCRHVVLKVRVSLTSCAGPRGHWFGRVGRLAARSGEPGPVQRCQSPAQTPFGNVMSCVRMRVSTYVYVRAAV
jgi:hypothetical protein